MRENWLQFSLLALTNAFVGAMVGMERSILPLVAEGEFKIISKTVVLSFLISFGIVKAISNLFAGKLSDLIGRKKILVSGWIAGLPVPVIIMIAPSWGWIVFANVLLAVNQGLCWSATVIMKIDLVGSKRRGFATGINEFAGYGAVALSAMLTGYLASIYALRPVPFYPGVIFCTTGLVISSFLIKETLGVTFVESHDNHLQSNEGIICSKKLTDLLFIESIRNRTFFALNQAGLVNNLNDAMIWGLIPIYLEYKDVDITQISTVAAVYPGVWGASQLFTGTLSDFLGRKKLIVSGMMLQSFGIFLLFYAVNFSVFITCAALIGLGTAMVYPTLLASVSDASVPKCRASALGVYRFWRDSGYAIGGLSAGVLSDLLNMGDAIFIIGVLTALSGITVSILMRETLSSALSASTGK